MITDKIRYFMSLYDQSIMAEKANKDQIADVLEDRLDRIKSQMSKEEFKILDELEMEFLQDKISFDEFYLNWAHGIQYVDIVEHTPAVWL